MRFTMALKTTKRSEAKIHSYTRELVNAGVLLASEVEERNDLVVRFWLVEVRSKEEAVEWARRCPIAPGESEMEIYQCCEPYHEDRLRDAGT